MVRIDARKVVGSGFPTDEGSRLAARILDEHRGRMGDLAVDLRKLPPPLLISGFFNAFLQQVADDAPELLEAARRVRWEVAFSFQEENIARWTSDFAPSTA